MGPTCFCCAGLDGTIRMLSACIRADDGNGNVSIVKRRGGKRWDEQWGWGWGLSMRRVGGRVEEKERTAGTKIGVS